MNALVLGEKGYAQAIRAWKFSKSSGNQTVPRLEKKKKKSSRFGILLLLYIKGEKSSFFQDFA